MKRAHLLTPVVVVTTAALAACAPVNEGVDATLDELQGAISSGADGTALAALLASDATVVMPEGAGHGRDEATAALVFDPPVIEGAFDVHHDVARARASRGGDDGLLFVQVDGEQVQRLAYFHLPIPDDEAPPALDAYGAAWATRDALEREAALEIAWSETGRYVDPTADVRGRDGLAAHITGFQTQFPLAQITTTSGMLVSGPAAHFTWQMDLAGGLVPFTPGMDVAFLDDDGRIALLAGFFGALD